MSRLRRDRTAEPVSRDQILRRERGQGNIPFRCSAHHEQDWQPYPVDPYYCYYICDDHTYIHTYRHKDIHSSIHPSIHTHIHPSIYKSIYPYNTRCIFMATKKAHVVFSVQVFATRSSGMFCFFGYVAFSRVIITKPVAFPSCLESTSLPDGTFLPRDHGLDSDISLCENSINQSNQS